MDDAFLALQAPPAIEQGGAERGPAEAFERRGPDDQIGDAGLVLDRDEDDAVGAARALPDQHEAGDRDAAIDRQGGKTPAPSPPPLPPPPPPHHNSRPP